ncbi:MAG: hypothetical protein HY270_09365 [Deltaproteobacteria bacterium]|nr:hypothetical protein [Deltaproteobacteria bacterium]
MQVVLGVFEVLFGKGDSDHPLWLLAVRTNILCFVVAVIVAVAAVVGLLYGHRLHLSRRDLAWCAGLTTVAALLRFCVEHNLAELGGIGYSRILLGYNGNFATAQLYSLLYAVSARDIEHAIFINRIAATLTIALVYVLCRRLNPASTAFAVCSAAFIALHPLHLLFSGTEALAISTSLLATASYLLLVLALQGDDLPAPARRWMAAGAASGLILLTQVRYENCLFLIPPVFYLQAHRHSPWLRRQWPAAVLFVGFFLAYAAATTASGVSYQHSDGTEASLRAAVGEAFGNPIFAIAPVVVGTLASIVSRRSRVRWPAPLPLVAAVATIALASKNGHHLARTYANQVLLVSMIAGYGVALLWESPVWVGRLCAVATMAWAVALPEVYWTNLRERHLETVEHDFFQRSLGSLPAGIDHVIVPDDEVLYRQSHSQIEAMRKYQMIAAAVGLRGVELIGMTRFLEQREEVDCSRSNCLFFRGVPCMGISHYWFGAEGCAKVMEMAAGDAVRVEDVVAGSVLDCSIYAGEVRRQICDPVRKLQRFGMYRVHSSKAWR